MVNTAFVLSIGILGNLNYLQVAGNQKRVQSLR